MKRRDVIRYLEAHGCEWLRESGNHTVYVNRQDRRHRPSRDTARSTTSSLARFAVICKYLSLSNKAMEADAGKTGRIAAGR